MTDLPTEQLSLFDFSDPAALSRWSSINDVVMGGVSEGGISWKGRSCMVFRGEVSFENNGGFSSIRTEGLEVDLGDYHGLVIKALGDGKKYKFNLRTDIGFDGVSYQCQFQTEPGLMLEYELPFDGFQPSYHGRKLSGNPPLDKTGIKRCGILIADKQEGPFVLEIEKIIAVRHLMSGD